MVWLQKILVVFPTVTRKIAKLQGLSDGKSTVITLTKQ